LSGRRISLWTFPPTNIGDWPAVAGRLAIEKVVFELPALPIGAPRRVNREPETSDVEEQSEILNLQSEICNLKSGICNRKSGVKSWASSVQQEHLSVVTDN
jgi:hypothetical protein